jgi:hypothetical protein
LILAAAIAATASASDLSPQTLQEFQTYMDTVDRTMQARPQSSSRLPVKPGAEPVIQGWNGKHDHDVTHGLIHDWIGAILVPNVKLQHAVAVLQNIDKYKNNFPQITTYKTLESNGSKSKVFMRLHKKKIITVVLDTYYDITQVPSGPGKHQIVSKSSRISEVSDAGHKNEHVKPPDTGFGFLWRLNSYWLLEERDGGLYLELRSVSLTRDIPTGLAWAVKPMVTSLPRESLASTLEGTAKAALWYSQQQ